MSENRNNFQLGVRILFENWTALRIAVQHELGGPQTTEKVNWFLENIVSYFGTQGSKLDLDDIQDYLLDVMDSEFNTALEDGSEKEISIVLVNLYKDCVLGKTQVLDYLKHKHAKKVDLPQVESSSDESDDDEVSIIVE